MTDTKSMNTGLISLSFSWASLAMQIFGPFMTPKSFVYFLANLSVRMSVIDIFNVST